MRFNDHYYVVEVSKVATDKAKNKFINLGNDEDEVNKYVDEFNLLSQKNKISGVDIFSLTFDELKKKVEDASKTKSKGEEKKFVKDNETKFVFENDSVLVVSPLSHKSSCKYGSGTKWCTTMKDDHYWKEYYDEGVNFYYIIPKDGSDKYAVAVYPDGKREIYDAPDDKMTERDFSSVLKEFDLDDEIFEPLDEDEVKSRLGYTQEDEQEMTGNILSALGISDAIVDNYDEVWDTVFNSVHTYVVDTIEATDWDSIKSYRNYVKTEIEEYPNEIENALLVLRDKYNIDSESVNNKIKMLEKSFIGQEIKYEIDKGEEGWDEKSITGEDWDLKYKSDSLEDMHSELDFDFDSLTDEQIKYIEGWLKYQYTNNHDAFSSFYDDIIQMGTEELRSGNGVSKEFKSELKELIDKVEKIEYGKQDHPKLDLQHIRYANYYLVN